jgi:hypothetical protein
MNQIVFAGSALSVSSVENAARQPVLRSPKQPFPRELLPNATNLPHRNSNGLRDTQIRSAAETLVLLSEQQVLATV